MRATWGPTVAAGILAAACGSNHATPDAQQTDAPAIADAPVADADAQVDGAPDAQWDCTPGVSICIGDEVHECTTSGQIGPVSETCVGTQICDAGACAASCAVAAAHPSSQGCELWAADLDSVVEVLGLYDPMFGCDLFGTGSSMNMPVCYDGGMATAGTCDPPSNTCPTGFSCQTQLVCVLDTAHQSFAVEVVNPWNRPVDVTLTNAAGTMATGVAPANGSLTLRPQALGFADQSIGWSVLGALGYRVTSSMPVTVYQFNPLTAIDMVSTDASLLVPREALGTRYVAMGWPSELRRPDLNDLNGFLTIVGVQDGTTLQVTPTANVRAGAGVPALTAGMTYSFTLDAYDVLSLQSVADGGDLTGTIVDSGTTPIAVFAGSEAASVPNLTSPGPGYSGPCCADHLEESMLPQSVWGTELVVARSKIRLPEVGGEPDVIRVVAGSSGTLVSFDPTPVSGTCPALGDGAWCEVEIATDTVVTATAPVMVGHYLKSVIWQHPTTGVIVGTGDPSLSNVIPSARARSTYRLYAPTEFTDSTAWISLPSTATVTLDGTDITGQLAPVGTSAYQAGRVAVAGGLHDLACTAPCEVELAGYDEAASYVLPGGFTTP